MSRVIFCLLTIVLFSFSACTEVPLAADSIPPVSSDGQENNTPVRDLPIESTPTPVVSSSALPVPSSPPTPSPSPSPLPSASPSPTDLIVKIIQPEKNTTHELERLIFLSAELKNPSNISVSFVEFRTEDTVLGLVPKSAFSSFSYDWKPENIKTGVYSIVAVALDANKTELARSESVEITLKSPSRSSGGGGGGASVVAPPPPAPTPTPAPTLASFNPNSGFPGNAIVLTGTNFTGATAVTFNGVAAASFTVDNATTITAIAPTGATTGVIAVTTGGGSVNSATNFTFVAPPVGVRFVKANATGANSGANWIDAYPDLQTALGVVASGEEIWIAAGTYKPTAVANRSATFSVNTDASLYGGFAGTEALRTARNFTTNVSILSGDLNGDDTGFTNNAENVFHVVSMMAANSRLDGLTIQGGNADAASGVDSIGGGVRLQANATLANNRFLYNSSNIVGGALYSSTQTVTVDNCTFNNNKADRGAALYSQGGTLNVSNNSTFSNNTATTAGGAIYSFPASTVTVANATFTSNTTTNSEGGAIYHNGGNLTVTDSTFTSNTAGSEGGAVFQNGDTGTYTRVIFQSNTATNFGGAICNANATVNVNESVFDTNTGVRGGAIFGNTMTGTFQNALFYNNSATQQGGAIAQPSGTTNIFNSTFVSNSATNSGGGIINGDTPSGSTFNLTNAILWNNTAPTGAQITVLNNTSVMTIGFTNLQGDLAGISNVNAATINDGTNNIATDPLFVNMADPNGADDSYRTADDGLQIQAGSGALDTGTATGAPAIDIVGTGTARPQGGGHDIGAYERP